MKSQQCKIIGLTGPIASGKNEAAKILRRRGAYVIDADEIGHSLYGREAPAWREIVKTFGGRVLVRGGKINRRKLGEIVFSNPKLLKKLNKIMHPKIVEEIKKELRTQNTEHRKKLIVINAAILKEMGLIPLVDEVWVVLAPKQKRLRWLMKEKGFTREQALMRIRVQPSDKDYIKIADKIIRNTGTIKGLKEKIVKIL